MKTDRSVEIDPTQKSMIYLGLLGLFCVLVAVVAFGGSLLELVHRWRVQEAYSHGFLIPFISAWLIWSRRDALAANIGRPSWAGPLLILIAALMHVVGQLSALFILSQVAFVIVLMGIVLSLGGYSLLKVVFVPLFFLVFAIPVPYFIDSELSWRLQLISSQLGVFFIRLLDIPVFLQGNVIDLGTYKLQVVNACSGLRYLYPLMSLGFLAAYLYQAPVWQRVLVFLSTIPITIVMNSFRIGVVGVMVDNFGPQDADGFLHMFEGWIIFVACAGLLVLEMYILARLFLRRNFFEVFYPPKLAANLHPSWKHQTFARAPMVSCSILVCATAVIGSLVSTRPEVIPQRQMFAAFPTTLGQWQGHPSSLTPDVEQGLKLTDYILSDYTRPDGHVVNFYVAYYASQRMGASPHSPSVCIPGNGWQIIQFERTHYRSKDSTVSLPLNRAVIARGSQKELVYYWFDERGMNIANEYLSKLYLLRDAILKNRTDGALVRLTTPLYPGERQADADKRLQAFMRVVVPKLAAYLPSANPAKIKPAMNSPQAAHS